MRVLTLVDAVEGGKTTEERQKDEHEDDAEPDDVMEHAAEGHQQGAQLLVGRQQVRNPGEAQYVGQREEDVSNLVHVRQHVYLLTCTVNQQLKRYFMKITCGFQTLCSCVSVRWCFIELV